MKKTSHNAWYKSTIGDVLVEVLELGNLTVVVRGNVNEIYTIDRKEFDRFFRKTS